MSGRRPGRWLLLVHQLPAKPSRLRVKVWRRLQGVGAVALKSSVYVLPNTAETREDFEWIRTEILAGGGEALVFAADATDELSSTQILEAVDAARREDWHEVLQRGRELESVFLGSDRPDEERRRDLRRGLKGLRQRAARADQMDRLGASGRRQAFAAIERLQRLLEPSAAPDEGGPSGHDRRRFRGRTWVTRPRPGIDRMASAWLIRRFIDPEARFRFAESVPEDDAVVPFDMFGVELGHQGDQVSFETLQAAFGLHDESLARIATMVHEVDLRQEPFSDSEAATVDRLVQGLRASYPDDDDRLLEQGMVIFESLYRSFLAESGA